MIPTNTPPTLLHPSGKKAVASLLHDLCSEAHPAVLSAVASSSELLLYSTLNMIQSGEVKKFTLLSREEALQDLIQRLQSIQKSTTPIEASTEILRVITLLSAWQSKFLLSYSRMSAGEDVGTIMGS